MSLFNRGEGARNRVFLDKVTAPNRTSAARSRRAVDRRSGSGIGVCDAAGRDCPVINRARAKYLFLALDRKGSAGRPLRAPDYSGNSRLNLVDQGYRTS